MTTSRNFAVSSAAEGFVDIVPRPEVALSAVSLLETIKQIRTKVGFQGGFEASTNMYLRTSWTTGFGIRLHGAGRAIAEALPNMDLFPVLEAEKPRIFEVRFIHDNLAHIDPRLVVTVRDLVEYKDQLTAYFRTKGAWFVLRQGQFVFNANAGLINFGKEMIDYCQPLYQHTSKINGSIRDGRAWVKLSGPIELFGAETLSAFENSIVTPYPGVRGESPAQLNVAVGIGSIDSIANMRRLYDKAVEISLQLGIHPLRGFTITHDESMTTTLVTSPLSSR